MAEYDLDAIEQSRVGAHDSHPVLISDLYVRCGRHPLSTQPLAG
jgi:hypothetical protein